MRKKILMALMAVITLTMALAFQAGRSQVFADIGDLLDTLENPNNYDTSSDDWFGWAVSTSDTYAIIGAPYEDDADGTSSGVAYIYDLSDGSLEYTLTNPNDYGTSTNDFYGYSVSISDTYAIVGAYQADESGVTASGSAYIYDLSDGSLEYTLTNPNNYGTSDNDKFGRSVSISDTYAIVGAHDEDDAGGTSSGVAYIYDLSDGSLEYTLENPNNYGTSDGDEFGFSVSISDTYAIIGAPYEDDLGGTSSGVAYIFDLTDGTLEYTLENPNNYDTSADDQFGYSVSISDTYAIIGARFEDDLGGTSSGVAYIFDLIDGTLEYTLENPNNYDTSETDRFGGAVAISDTYAIVGASHEDDADGTTSGVAYTYQMSIFTWTVTYDSNGGSAVDPEDVNDGDFASEPSDPTKTGYTFAGWFTDDGVWSDEWVFATDEVTEDTTLYAKWSINEWLLTFDTNGGSFIFARDLDYGETITIYGTDEPDKEGYTFEGYYYDDETFLLPVNSGTDTMPDDDLQLHAKWTANSYTITFDSNGGSAVSAITQDFGTSVTEPSEPTKEEYLFQGWYSDEALTTAYTFTTMPSNNITLYASWELIYDVIFNFEIDDATVGVNQEFDVFIELNLGDSFAGYDFELAYDDTILEFIGLTSLWDEGSILVNDAYSGYLAFTDMVTRYDIVPVLRFAKITFRVLSGTSDGLYDIMWIPTDEESPFPEVTQNMFAWIDESYDVYEFYYPQLNFQQLEVGGDPYLAVEFNSNGGSEIETQYMASGDSAEEPVDPTRLGYIFSGWYSDVELATEFDFATSITSDTTLYGKWALNSYTLTFETNEGTVIAPVVYEYGESIEVPEEPTREGYSFAGWYTNDEFSNPFLFSTMPAEDVTVYARWIQYEELPDPPQPTEYDEIFFEYWYFIPLAAAGIALLATLFKKPKRRRYRRY